MASSIQTHLFVSDSVRHSVGTSFSWRERCQKTLSSIHHEFYWQYPCVQCSVYFCEIFRYSIHKSSGPEAKKRRNAPVVCIFVASQLKKISLYSYQTLHHLTTPTLVSGFLLCSSRDAHCDNQLELPYGKIIHGSVVGYVSRPKNLKDMEVNLYTL